MVTRRPLVLVDGQLTELSPPDQLPADSVPGASGAVFGTIPAVGDMVAGTLYVDQDCKQQGWLNTAGERCVVYAGNGERLLPSPIGGRLLLAQGGYMRTSQ